MTASQRVWRTLRDAASSVPTLRNGRAGDGRPHLEVPDRYRDLDEVHDVLERILVENFLPFWTSDEIIEPTGGYRLFHDRRHRWLGPAHQHVVSQTRTVWFLARLSRTPWGRPEHLELARHGFLHLRDAMWDHEYGGFHWEIAGSAHVPIAALKHTYGQAFGLYTLAEYALATGDADAADLADRLFALLDEHVHDDDRGGYREFLAVDWSPTVPSVVNPRRGVPASYRSRDVHVHVVEGMLAYDTIAGAPLVRERLRELAGILTWTIVGPDGIGCEWFDERWRPILDGRLGDVSFGHELEGVWLSHEAFDRAGVPRSLYAARHVRAVEQVLRDGMDPRRGDIADFGPRGRRPRHRYRKDWVHAEALIALLQLAVLEDDEWFLDAFRLVLTWVIDHQVDWEEGGWHRQILPSGEVIGQKAGDWQAPYHVGRSMIECMAMIDTLR